MPFGLIRHTKYPLLYTPIEKIITPNNKIIEAYIYYAIVLFCYINY